MPAPPDTSGTTALNAVTYADMAWRARPASSAPEEAVERMAASAGQPVPGGGKERSNRLRGLGALAGIGDVVGAVAVHPPASGEGRRGRVDVVVVRGVAARAAPVRLPREAACRRTQDQEQTKSADRRPNGIAFAAHSKESPRPYSPKLQLSAADRRLRFSKIRPRSRFTFFRLTSGRRNAEITGQKLEQVIPAFSIHEKLRLGPRLFRKLRLACAK